MNKSQIEAWLRESRSDIRYYFLLKQDWWPTTNGNNQSYATAWANGFFLRGLMDLHPARPDLWAHCSSGKHEKTEAAVWQARYSHSKMQLMLDFVAADLGDRMPLKLTGESEMSPSLPVGGFIEEKSYIWDYFKLLTIPCRDRMFMARIAKAKGQSDLDRMKILADRMIDLYRRYQGVFISSDDRFCAAIIPAAKRRRNETLILWSQDGGLQCERITLGTYELQSDE